MENYTPCKTKQKKTGIVILLQYIGNKANNIFFVR